MLFWRLLVSPLTSLPQLDQLGADVSWVGPVFFTHHHFDHVDDLFAVIISATIKGREGTLPIYGPAGTRQIVDALFMGGGP